MRVLTEYEASYLCAKPLHPSAYRQMRAAHVRLRRLLVERVDDWTDEGLRMVQRAAYALYLDGREGE